MNEFMAQQQKDIAELKVLQENIAYLNEYVFT
jgi:hypothetical protein